MPEDLNAMHLPTGSAVEREIFDPVNAWEGAPSRIVVQTNRMAGGVYQVGYDPETGKHWLRTGNSGAWADWTSLPDLPPGIVPEDRDMEAGQGGEYATRDMHAKRGPGRPRKESSE